MPEFLDLLLLLLSLGLLWLGAEGLVRGASGLALRAGLTPLVVGLTVVAFGTSAPEMVVSVKAAMAGQGAIAVGNIVGSNIFNVGIILGLAAVISPMRVQMQLIRIDVPIMIAVAFALVLVLLDGRFSRGEAVLCCAGLVAYTILNLRLARRESQAVKQEFQESVPAAKGSGWKDGGFILGGLVVLVIGSRLLVDSSISIAQALGVSEAIIGLTIVAAGTSMPELATSVIAALRKESDIAIGNVVGSNTFNVLGVGGVSAFVIPLESSGITSFDLGMMCVMSVLLLPLLWTGFAVRRWEGGVLLALYGAYLWKLWP